MRGRSVMDYAEAVYAELGYRRVGTGGYGRCRCCGEPVGLTTVASLGLLSAEALEVFRARCGRCGGHPEVEGYAQPGRGQGRVLVRLRGLASGGPAPGYEDGEYLSEYDPLTEGRSPGGEPMLSLVVATTDPNLALRFADVMAARREWLRWDGYLRPDGQPSRPLLAFNIEIANQQQEGAA